MWRERRNTGPEEIIERELLFGEAFAEQDAPEAEVETTDAFDAVEEETTKAAEATEAEAAEPVAEADAAVPEAAEAGAEAPAEEA